MTMRGGGSSERKVGSDDFVILERLNSSESYIIYAASIRLHEVMIVRFHFPPAVQRVRCSSAEKLHGSKSGAAGKDSWDELMLEFEVGHEAQREWGRFCPGAHHTASQRDSFF